jgi:hypothetical protein
MYCADRVQCADQAHEHDHVTDHLAMLDAFDHVRALRDHAEKRPARGIDQRLDMPFGRFLQVFRDAGTTRAELARHHREHVLRRVVGQVIAIRIPP